MNYSILRYILFKFLVFTACFLIIPCIIALIYKEPEGWIYLFTAVITLVVGLAGIIKKPKNQSFYAKEGFVAVALCWIILALLGSLPFTLTKEIPNYIDSIFETTSGFTTTGASILTDIEALSHCSLFWRNFTNWIGGMGVLVFILAIAPLSNGYNLHLMKAESPGPSVGKLVPKMKQTATILYSIYFALTVIEILLLIIFGMPIFDSITLSMGTAGTGGFAVLNTSAASYNDICQVVITIFMILFGVNFTFFYFIIMKKLKSAFKMEEVRWYFIIIVSAIIIIFINVKDAGVISGSTFDIIRHVAFQVGSIITTTGFSTTDFNTWPELSKTILVILMFVGACAGSTGGGLKVSRILTWFRAIHNEIYSLLHPKRVKAVQLENKPLSDPALRSILVYFVTFTFIFMGSLLLVSVDGFDFTTNFTAITATINNIGPGLNKVGPTGNFAEFSNFSKIVMSFDMLIGRLEIFPIIILFTPSTWRRGR